ncbi:hypothetical protein, partial [Streptomyces sp. e14]|uniref:hypothetical protein n=1 Tax=Streptomyces sp. e14 TaxID=645465 RepID=UPI001E50AFAC
RRGDGRARPGGRPGHPDTPEGADDERGRPGQRDAAPRTLTAASRSTPTNARTAGDGDRPRTVAAAPV